jgi:hypothetical protein
MQVYKDRPGIIQKVAAENPEIFGIIEKVAADLQAMRAKSHSDHAPRTSKEAS